MSEVGKRIKRLRELRSRTTSDIAAEIGVPVSTYRDWEYGRSIRGEYYLPLSRALHVSVYELLTGGKPKKSILIDQAVEIERKAVALRREWTAGAGLDSRVA